MTSYVALLRGVNLGSRNKVSMHELRRVLAGLGAEGVTTYLQSGNAVFASAEQDRERLAGDIERALAEELNVPVRVLLRTAGELRELVAGNPYLDRETDLTRLHVTFLAAPADPERAERLAVPAGDPGAFTVAGRDVYLHTPDGYGRSKLSNSFFEQKLGVDATTRNWRTVTKLRDLATA